MKITLIFLTLVVFANSLPFQFNIGGWSGVVNSFGRINGVESHDQEEVNSKAEEVLKGLIEKHLEGKRNARNPQKQPPPPPQVPQQQQQQQPVAVPIPAQQDLTALQQINWENHSETRDMINQRVPGGVEAVDALLKLLQENQANGN